MTIATDIAATEKQIAFVLDLVKTREYDEAERDRIVDLIDSGDLTKKEASAVISLLVDAPRKKAAVSSSPLQALLASIPKSKYAVPVDELMLTEHEDAFSGDLVFLELKEFMGTLYVRRLIGAPGRFARERMTADQVTTLMSIVASEPYKYAKLFGDHYACCGSCGAELTDQRSRELMLGPECRKKFGK